MLRLDRNPIVYRHFCNLKRPTIAIGGSVAFAGILFFIYATLAVNMGKDASGEGLTPQRLRGILAVICLAGQFAMAFAVTPLRIAGCLHREEQEKTIEFFHTLPLTPTQKLIGLLAGRMLGVVIVTVVLMALTLLCGASGGLDMASLWWAQAIVWPAMLAMAVAGFVVGAGNRGGSAVLLIIVMVVLQSSATDLLETKLWPLLTAQPITMFNRLIDSDPSTQWEFAPSGTVGFFGWRVPWQICPIIFYLHLTVMCFFVGRASLVSPEGRPTPRKILLPGMAVLHLLIAGFLVDAAGVSDAPEGLIALYLLGFAIVTLLWAFAACPGRWSAFNSLQAPDGQKLQRMMLGDLTSHQTCLPVVSMLLLWALPVAVCAWLGARMPVDVNTPGLLLAGAACFAYMLAYLCLFAVGKTLSDRNGGGLGILMVAAMVLLPAIFAGASGSDMPLALTPALLPAAILDLMDVGFSSAAIKTETGWCLIVGPGLAGIFGLLLLTRYAQLATAPPPGRSDRPPTPGDLAASHASEQPPTPPTDTN